MLCFGRAIREALSPLGGQESLTPSPQRHQKFLGTPSLHGAPLWQLLFRGDHFVFTSWRNHPLYLIVLSLIIISGYFFRGPSGAYGDSLTKETYDSIQIDMGQDEVDDILGGINDPLDRSVKCV